MKKILLGLLGLLLTVVGLSDNTMLLIFPMWIFTWLGRAPLRRLTEKTSLGVAFIGYGVFFGMLTEIFAIANNRNLPPEQRILLSPDPILDLVYGIFYYFMLIVTWYLLIRLFVYSKKEVFFLMAIYGIMTEEVGQVFVRIFTQPVIGPLYAISVSFVYGIFPLLAYLLVEDKLPQERRSNIVVRSVVAAIALFLEWAIYGLFVLPTLKRIF
jgi:hypothetical protein